METSLIGFYHEAYLAEQHGNMGCLGITVVEENPKDLECKQDAGVWRTIEALPGCFGGCAWQLVGVYKRHRVIVIEP